jgi:hypothetical protein
MGEEGRSMDDRAFASATKLSGEIRDRRIGCVELLDFYLGRAERHNPTLNAIVAWRSSKRENAPALPMPPSNIAPSWNNRLPEAIHTSVFWR